MATLDRSVRRVALLRGINVGGRNIVPMAELRADLEASGLEGVRTYIQSGNVVMDASPEEPSVVARRIADAIDARHGFRPQVLVLESNDLQLAVADNPFPDAESDPKALHMSFLTGPAAPDPRAIDAVCSASERWALHEKVFYLHAPDGIGRSKLAGRLDKLLGVPATGRNLRTARKLLAMIDE